jgi:hypothetical protein
MTIFKVLVQNIAGAGLGKERVGGNILALRIAIHNKKPDIVIVRYHCGGRPTEVNACDYYYVHTQLAPFNHYKHSFIYTNTDYNVHAAFPLLCCLPLRIPLYDSLPLTWNPPCCDRIRPPRSPIACKLNSPILCPCSLATHSKIFDPPRFLTSKYTLIRTVSRTWLT